MEGINFTDEREYAPKLTFKNNDAIHNIKQRYLVSDVIFLEIKNGKITDKRGLEISTDFIIEREHYLGNGWGYVIL